jgi:hypothetical protein
LKLDRGNPNLMKQKALRVNQHNPLESFSIKRKHRATVGFVPMPRDPDTVPPPQLSVWERPVYKPDHSGYQRPNSDHSRIKSRGL